MKKIVLYLFLILGGTLFAQEVHFAEWNDLKLELEIRKTGKDITAVVECTNLRDFDVYVPLFLINILEEFNGKIMPINNWFDIRNRWNRRAGYSGIMVKPVYPPPVDECVLLKKGEKMRFEVPGINRYYSFPLFSRNLTIMYDGPLGESNIVEFSRY